MNTRAMFLALVGSFVLSFVLLGQPCQAQDARPVTFYNSTDDVNTVRIHCLHFNGKVFFHDVPKNGSATQPLVLLGERVVVVYNINGQLLKTARFKLIPGNGPAKVAVFGNANEGYQVDFGF